MIGSLNDNKTAKPISSFVNVPSAARLVTADFIIWRRNQRFNEDEEQVIRKITSETRYLVTD